MPVHSIADAALRVHLEAFFADHAVELRTWPHGPIHERVPGFGVYAISPGPRLKAWSYVTTGCWDAAHQGEHGLEFILSCTRDDERHVERLAILAHYHAGPPGQRLDLGHTTYAGEPWLPGSALTHDLIALPYAFGPDLERCDWRNGHIRILTVQPITEAERDFKVAEGVEALEQRFEDAGIAWTDPFRPSVV
ncbi:suppressor of fused protein SUFU [Solirubrobacter pauli]|uniref:Suppressor of fused protein SUFU n=1 Tax=Solirubrobacter pauli TaxID=166793 RepID=A0A660L5Z6_9ACTN|nr:suppressor of fused domain protein [Solirubrobacter pauli]RKQ88309.1 suppressor of fused protein SUFU [Solirubrobacter pauli]